MKKTLAETAVAPAPSRLTRYVPWAMVLAVVLFAGAVRMRLLQIPLERDEGEYAYAGQLLLHGVPPYREAFNMKFPGVYAAYAVMMAAFGQTIAGIHLGFLLCNAATIVLMFLLGRRLFGATAGAAASAAYALMSLGAGVYGTEAHATHFVVLPVLAACLLLLRAVDTGRTADVFWSGMLFGIAILMKQHGVFFAVFGAFFLLRKRPEWRKAAIYIAGVCVPLAFAGVLLWSAGVFGRFWFWTFTYAREYVLENPLSEGINLFTTSFARVVGSNLLLWLFAAAGLALIWWKKEERGQALFATALLFFSFLAICPGLIFREHYFVLMLPAVALLAGAGLGSLRRLAGNLISIGLFSTALLFAVFQQGDFFFRLTPLEAARRMYSINPFPEAIPVADYLRRHTAESERIAVLGSEPEIYFYAGRRSVTGYVYTYGMMEPQPFALAMQNEMIHDIETARPLYIVLGNVSTTWNIRSNSSLHIFQWWNAYSERHYRKVGVVEVISPEHTEYHWDNVESYDPKTGVVLEVYRRKD